MRKIYKFCKKMCSRMGILCSTVRGMVIFWLEGVAYSAMPRLRGNILISLAQPGSVTFGKGVVINSGRKRNPVGLGIQTSVMTMGNGSIHIGDRVGMSNVALIARESITVENDVLLGSGVVIYDNDFHALDAKNRCGGGDNDIRSAPVLIKEGAFVGAGAMILKGVTTGRNSIVGAGSVVSRSIPDGEIWGGNPARFIKKAE